ncbi:hypothetical protein NUW54_g13657 [Trametes sanguinea]|uniref:Uncharacterized protein n=1 Tax=Trametes sanguinea TaxID=158606 RepID=A0ACC1MIV2_9APHY|nr:hypothetical protein NUW54_g13657 [Trametes sanguinea]
MSSPQPWYPAPIHWDTTETGQYYLRVVGLCTPPSSSHSYNLPAGLPRVHAACPSLLLSDSGATMVGLLRSLFTNRLLDHAQRWRNADSWVAASSSYRQVIAMFSLALVTLGITTALSFATPAKQARRAWDQTCSSPNPTNCHRQVTHVPAETAAGSCSTAAVVARRG